jgi:hypothetical protein
MKLNLFLISATAMVNAAIGTDPVQLETAADYAILAKTGISTVPNSVITGDIAVSPIAAAAPMPPDVLPLALLLLTSISKEV